MDCDDIRLENARLAQFEDQIDETDDFNLRSAAGLLGDFGIGNKMAKDDARKALRERRTSIRQAHVDKGC